MRSDNILLGRARYMRRCGRTCYSHEDDSGLPLGINLRAERASAVRALPRSGRHRWGRAKVRGTILQLGRGGHVCARLLEPYFERSP